CPLPSQQRQTNPHETQSTKEPKSTSTHHTSNQQIITTETQETALSQHIPNPREADVDLPNTSQSVIDISSIPTRKTQELIPEIQNYTQQNKPDQQNRNSYRKMHSKIRYTAASLPRYPSCKHYTKSYKCSTLTMMDVKDFHANFYKHSSKVSQDNFIISFNLGFGSPRTDVCSKCLELGERIKLEQDEEKIQQLITESRIHKLRAKAFFALLREKRDDLLTISFDYQKNLTLPKIPDQSVYYSRQLYLYNFTTVPGDSHCKLSPENVRIFAWTEDQHTKGANEIASAVFYTLNNSNINGIRKIRLMADGCGGQNKNTIMLGMCLKSLSTSSVEELELIFPVVGHSFIPPDRVFVGIDKKIRRQDQIIEPKEYFNIFEEHGCVVELGKDVAVFDWKSATREVLKPPAQWHIKFNMVKRFLLKKGRNNTVTVRGEQSYRSDLGVYKTVCKPKKNLESLNPLPIGSGIPPKQAKLQDVAKLLTKHYGTAWKGLTCLRYYKNVFEKYLVETEQPMTEMKEKRLSKVVQKTLSFVKEWKKFQMCFNCQALGHTAGNCQKEKICPCGNPPHEGPCPEPKKCVNCECPKLKAEAAIQKVKVMENITYAEAKRKVNITTPKPTTSYSAAVQKSSEMNIQQIISTIIPHIETAVRNVISCSTSKCDHFKAPSSGLIFRRDRSDSVSTNLSAASEKRKKPGDSTTDDDSSALDPNSNPTKKRGRPKRTAPFPGIIGIHGTITLKNLENNLGLIPMKLSTAKITKNCHSILYFYDVNLIINEVNDLKKKTDNVAKLSRKYIEHYKHSANYLNGLYFLERKVDGKLNDIFLSTYETFPSFSVRIKRGLINGLGSIFKAMTGNLDASDGEKFESLISDLQHNQNKLSEAINSQKTLSVELIDNFNKTKS
ncbi:unnamed protein product, partial [Acanthoscelides obtectus]